MIYVIATTGPPTVTANARPSSKLQRSTKSLQKQPVVRSLQPLGSLNCLQRFLLFWFFSFDNFCHRSHANRVGPGQPCALQTGLFRCGLGARRPQGAGGLLRPGPRPDPPSAPGQGWPSSLGCLPQGRGCPPCPWFSSWSPALLPPAGHCPHVRGPGLSAGLVTLGNCSPELDPDPHKIPTLAGCSTVTGSSSASGAARCPARPGDEAAGARCPASAPPPPAAMASPIFWTGT